MKKLINLKTIVLVFALANLSFIYAQVGIGTTTPRTQLDINGAISTKDGGLLTLTNGNNNNIALPSTSGVIYSNYRITGPTAFFTITGLIPVTGADGQIVTLQNTTNQIMVIEHNIGGAAANRILIPSEQDLILTGRYSSITLMYSSAQNRWIVQNKLSDTTYWYYPPSNIDANTTYNLTATIPSCNSFSSVNVSLIGDWGGTIGNNITIHSVEARTGEVRFVISNNTGIFGGGTDYLNMDFIISVNN
ncbi:hypothetical protein [Psychroserpens luteus]|uniref:Uncharacterized protein n=1 Tax=Psychroserpens luteus TaxID=1434066 RepID=A0ABW5ZN56_9FLAO|nr:hypothetical protein [Psychroserpens luteus]